MINLDHLMNQEVQIQSLYQLIISTQTKSKVKQIREHSRVTKRAAYVNKNTTTDFKIRIKILIGQNLGYDRCPYLSFSVTRI